MPQKDGKRNLRVGCPRASPQTAAVRKVLLGPTGREKRIEAQSHWVEPSRWCNPLRSSHAVSPASSTDGCRPAPLLGAPDSAVRASKSGKPAQVMQIPHLRLTGRNTI